MRILKSGLHRGIFGKFTGRARILQGGKSNTLFLNRWIESYSLKKIIWWMDWMYMNLMDHIIIHNIEGVLPLFSCSAPTEVLFLFAVCAHLSLFMRTVV
jgi:hypothetical protein